MQKPGLRIAPILLLLAISGCKGKTETADYLKLVLGNLERIESAAYTIETEGWQPGDTTPMVTGRAYVREIINPADSTIGSSFVNFDYDDRNRMNFGYDGRVRISVYHDVKGIMIDDFTFRPLPFRPMSAPFINYTGNIIRYALETNDSIDLSLEDRGDHLFFRLVINEERQVEFFGKAHHMPENPYNLGETTSIYEIWISKSNDLPYKVRREMSHNISVTTCFDLEPNTFGMEDLDIFAYLPPDYEVRNYGERRESGQKETLAGKKAPDWSLKDVNDREIALQDLNSKVLLINFTGIGCGPCQASIPFLNDLKNHFSEEDFRLVAIETWAGNTLSHKNYIARNNINYMFLGANEEVIEQYQTGRAAPVFFLLDEHRIIRKVINGYSPETTGTEIMNTIRELITRPD